MDLDLKAAPNGLSLAALVFGIFAVLCSFTVVTTPFFASMAIMFSWLSRGDKKMCGQAKAGNILAVVSIALSLIVCLVILFAFGAFIFALLDGITSGISSFAFSI